MLQIRPWLFLGKHRDTRDLPLLQKHQVGAMLQLAGPVEQPAIQSLYVPLEDGFPIKPEVLKKGLNFILAQHQKGKNVFVSCGAGISRSATYVIAALKETENTNLLEAYQTVLQVHPGALPHPALWQSLSAYYQENTPYLALLKLYNRT